MSSAMGSSRRLSPTGRPSGPAEVVAGPAVIEEEGSTLFVEPGMCVERAAEGSLLIETGAAG